MTLRLASHYIDPTGNPAFSDAFREAAPFEGPVARVKTDDGRSQLIDTSGRAVGSAYDFIEPFVDGFACANNGGSRVRGSVRGGTWTLLDPQGNACFKPLGCTVLMKVSDGRVTFLTDNRWGFADLQGNVVVPPTYKFMGLFSNGLVVAATDAGDVYLDHSGQVVIHGPFQEATDFNEGFAKVKMNGRWGLIDRSGALVHEAVYDKMGTVAGGGAWAVRGGQCSVLVGSKVLGDGFADVKQVRTQGVWPVKRGERWGLLHPNGSIVGDFDNAGGIDEGLAMANVQGRWGFARADGTIAIEPRYDDLRGFVQGFASARLEGTWRLLDQNGTELPGQYEDVKVFSNGRCAVKRDGLWGYVDTRGEVVVNPVFVQAGAFNNDRAPVQLPDEAPLEVFAGGGPELHALPLQGLSHPVYEGCGPDTRTHVFIGFEGVQHGPQRELIEIVVRAWEHQFKPQTAWRAVEVEHISMSVTGIADPVRAISLLIDTLAQRVPIREVITNRWEHLEGHPVAGPLTDPRARKVKMSGSFDDFEGYWNAAWSDEPPVPSTENHFYLKGGFLDSNRKFVLEQRGMPVWFPDVRVCFGALNGHGEEYLPADAAGQQIQEALNTAMQNRFKRVWRKEGSNAPFPSVTSRAGDPGIELVRYRGKTGYAFAIDARNLLQWHAPSTCRYREPELLDAIRGVVLAHGLEPVLMWNRYQDPIPGTPLGTPSVVVINLWRP